MLGPIIQQELRHAGRRTRLHLLRWAYALWLVVQLVWFLHLGPGFTRLPGVFPYWRLLPAAEHLVQVLLFQQLLLLVLVAPAYTAGAITQEKERGTLQLLLTAGFTSSDLVGGKFLARLGEPLLLVLTGLPLICFYVGLRECDWLVALTLGVLPLGPLLGLGAAGLLASVWTRTTREALLAVYALGLLAAVAVWAVGGPLRGLDPLYVLDAAWGEPRQRVVILEDASFFATKELVATYHEAPDLGELATRLLWSLLSWCALTAVCLGVAVWRLRPAYLRQLEAPGRGRHGAWVGWRPAMTDDPLRWKECHVEGLAPLAILRRVPTWLALTGVVLGTVGLAVVLNAARDGGLAEMVLIIMFLALLVTAVRSATAISGERERHTWEGLLLTTLTSRELVQGKLRGIVAAGRGYLIAAAVPTLLIALRKGLVAFVLVAYALGLTWRGLLLTAAIGLDASERYPSSWKSILVTLLVVTAQVVFLFILSPCLLGFEVVVVSLLPIRLVSDAGLLFALVAVCGLNVYLYGGVMSWQADRYLIRAEKCVELSRPPPPGSERRLGWPTR